ncbi:2Fe-2S iron-sulfur cluster-binding protein [Hydrogenibacillus schlegelii]|nr:MULTISPECIES: 2Fe-2S iron-sulfur cluster-binding protein [Hydrogenibacillus]
MRARAEGRERTMEAPKTVRAGKAEPKGAVRIRIDPDGVVVVGRAGANLLSELRETYYGRVGRPAFPGCRSGGCGYCKVELLEGEVMLGDTYSRGALTDEERADGRILMCRAELVGDIAIRMLPKDDPLARLLLRLKREGQT